MKVFLTLALLLLSRAVLLAQPAPPLPAYSDARGRYQLACPPTWQAHPRAEGLATGPEATFAPADAPGSALAGAGGHPGPG